MPSTSMVAAATTSSSLPAAMGGDRDKDKPSTSTSESGDGSKLENHDESGSRVGNLSTPGPSATSIGLICVSGESDFDVIRVWGENVIQVGSCFPFCAAVH